MKVEKFKYDSDIKVGDCCPECDASWDGGDIYERFLKGKFDPADELHNNYKDKTLDEIKDTAGSYGWTEENKIRFGNVIGVEDGTYDGVSYWQCPKCEVAWDRFKGTRTDRFIRSAAAGVIRKLQELEEENTKKELANWVGEDHKEIIYNAMQTPDGTIIESTHRHDYVTHTDENGEMYMVDGGKDYLKRSVNEVPAKDLSMYVEDWTPEYHEKARKVVRRGGRGKDGRQPLTWVPVCEMNDVWVNATIDYNRERGMGLKKSWFTRFLAHEVQYRKTNEITVEDVE